VGSWLGKVVLLAAKSHSWVQRTKAKWVPSFRGGGGNWVFPPKKAPKVVPLGGGVQVNEKHFRNRGGGRKKGRGEEGSKKLFLKGGGLEGGLSRNQEFSWGEWGGVIGLGSCKGYFDAGEGVEKKKNDCLGHWSRSFRSRQN